jgi:Ca2+-binding RTX toxin-like protein
MSIIDASASTEALNFNLFSTQFNFVAQDPAGPNSATQYSWLTTGPDKVTVTGTGMDFNGSPPTAGNVEEIEFDLSNNGSVDATITDITGVTGGGAITAGRLAVMVGSTTNFFNEIMSFDDDVTGSAFNDTLKLGGGDDTVLGGNGNDFLSGEAGNDSLSGEAGNDTLSGGTGADTMNGGFSNDVYFVDNIGDVASEVASGVDLVNASITHTLSVNLENLTLTGIANINGTGNNTRANVITGNSGNNVLAGLGLNDTLRGNSGNDTLDGGTGADNMDGQAGNDVYIVDNAGDVAADTGGGVDRVDASVTHILSAAIEHLTLTGIGNINGTGNALGNTINGNSGNNVLSGLGGSDTLNGNFGNDTLNGGTSADTVTGGFGNDRVIDDDAVNFDNHNGGFGTDTIDYSPVTFGNGIVTIDLQAGLTSVNGGNTEAIVGFENAEGSQGGETIRGSTLANVISGNGGNDLIEASSGNDTLQGDAGNDTLDGGAGKDTHIGGSGNDTFDFDAVSDSPAGVNCDVLQAGGGGNAFDVPGANAGDIINLVTIDAITGGANDAFTFGGTGVGTIHCVDSGTTTLVLGNVSGGAGDVTAEFQINIEDGATLAAAYTALDFAL